MTLLLLLIRLRRGLLRRGLRLRGLRLRGLLRRGLAGSVGTAGDRITGQGRQTGRNGQVVAEPVAEQGTQPAPPRWVVSHTRRHVSRVAPGSAVLEK
jgi:hypothetical protein